MDEETKNLLYKVLLWGGGALLFFIVLNTALGAVFGAFRILWTALTNPLGLAVLGGAGYLGYRHFRKRRQSKIEGSDRFKLDK